MTYHLNITRTGHDPADLNAVQAVAELHTADPVVAAATLRAVADQIDPPRPVHRDQHRERRGQPITGRPADTGPVVTGGPCPAVEPTTGVPCCRTTRHLGRGSGRHEGRATDGRIVIWADLPDTAAGTTRGELDG